MAHPIPPITEPLGRYWVQPPRDEIAVGTHTASIHQDTFKALPEYSASLPTGTYEGKMWKAGNGHYWQLLWYEKHSDPSKLWIRTRRIIIIDSDQDAENIAFSVSL